MKEKYNKGELTIEVLKGLAVGGIIVSSFALPGLSQVVTLFGAKNYKDRDRLKKCIDRLKRDGYIKINKKGDEEFVTLTEKGRQKVLLYDIDNLSLNKNKRWDGLWRVVIFDIPEEKKHTRNVVSAKLREIGFYNLQRSTYVYPHDCRAEINLIKKYFRSPKDIIYMTVKNIEGDDKIRQYFKLAKNA